MCEEMSKGMKGGAPTGPGALLPQGIHRIGTAAKAPGPSTPPLLCRVGAKHWKDASGVFGVRGNGDRAGSQRPGYGVGGPRKE